MQEEQGNKEKEVRMHDRLEKGEEGGNEAKTGAVRTLGHTHGQLDLRFARTCKLSRRLFYSK